MYPLAGVIYTQSCTVAKNNARIQNKTAWITYQVSRLCNSVYDHHTSVHFRVVMVIWQFLSLLILVINKLIIEAKLQTSLKGMSNLPGDLPSSPSSSVIHTTMDQAMKSTMEDLFNIQPNPFQQRIIPQILMMMKGMTQPRPLLLVRSTGGGKSVVPQTCGCTKAGVTIVLENTQALGADQCSKLDKLNKANIITYQLDLLKSDQQRTQFAKDIEAHLHPTNTSATSCLVSIFIFSSPEAVISSHFFASVKAIINANKLSLFCIDEVHQYIEFGTTFLKEFCQLKDILSAYAHTFNAYI